MSDCKHWHVRAWTFSDSGDIAGLWSCSDCGLKFFPGDRVLSDEEMAKREIKRLRAALQDALSGWRYIRETHGDLYGVGWDRVQRKAEAALAEQK